MIFNINIIPVTFLNFAQYFPVKSVDKKTITAYIGLQTFYRLPATYIFNVMKIIVQSSNK